MAFKCNSLKRRELKLKKQKVVPRSIIICSGPALFLGQISNVESHLRKIVNLANFRSNRELGEGISFSNYNKLSKKNFSTKVFIISRKITKYCKAFFIHSITSN